MDGADVDEWPASQIEAAGARIDGTADVDEWPVQAKLLRSQPSTNTNVTRETTHPASKHDRSHTPHLREHEPSAAPTS